jgi:hypothetical protein
LPIIIINSRPQLADKNGGVGTPEMRMPAMIVASFAVPIGLLYVIPSFLARGTLVYGRVPAGMDGPRKQNYTG